MDALNKVAGLSFPLWLTKNAPFLPNINLGCIRDSGVEFLDESSATGGKASISGFFDAVLAGCSSEDMSLVIDGGYMPDREELEVNVVVSLGGIKNV